MTQPAPTTTAPPGPAGARRLAMFPGQGAQRPGMAAHLLGSHAGITAPIFAAADLIAGFGVTELCVSAPKEALVRTEVTQLAVLTTSIATWEVLRGSGFRPAAVAGHSLGEFAALVAAEVIDIETALTLVRLRGELMAGVAARTEGGMLAVLGLPAATVERLCAERTGAGVAEVANYNDPQQTVVSGHRPALARIASAARAAGARKVVELDVGAPFHCSLMAPITEAFAAELAVHRFADPAVPVLSSVTGDYITDGAHARSLLREQLCRPVRWTGVLRTAHRDGTAAYLELGPGRVLSSLVKTTLADPPVFSTGDARRIDAAIRQITEERNL